MAQVWHVSPQRWNIFPERGVGPRGLGHVTLLKIVNPFNISGTDEATLFNFGKWIDYGKCKSHRWGEKCPLKGTWFGSRDSFKNFKPPLIFLEWMKIRCLHLASNWIDYSKSHPRVKNSTRNGRGLGHVIVFGMKPCSLNFANASTMATAIPWVKNPPSETGVVSVTWPLFKF